MNCCSRSPSLPLLRKKALTAALAAFGLFALLPATLSAIPVYARRHNVSCVECHSVPPKLNSKGEAFLARGYRLGAGNDRSTIPLSVWITGRHEDRSANNLDDVFLPKVELMAGGPMGDSPASYFVEWRVVSLELQNNGTHRDRSGRFEDVIFNWEFDDRQTLRIGQFRALNQYDVSLRLSASEPAVFSTGLAGRTQPGDARITGLRTFSPSGRSPGAAYTFKSVPGTTSSDGLFHSITLPFVGELSAPLNSEARREASFELEGPAKGVFLETFYRRGLNSIGAHAFVDDDRWLASAVGRVNRGDFNATAAFGVDDATGRTRRHRYSVELEYLPVRMDAFRGGLGFRLEQVTRAGRDPAYVPYLALTGPNLTYTFLLQVEGRFQGSARTLLIDLSALF
jgi:hypothetical protein